MNSKHKRILLNLTGSLILATGLYNIHAVSDVTEGGVLGLTLLFKHFFDISPALSGFLLTAACYLLGAGVLGKEFVFYSVFACGGFSLFYRLWECFDPVWPGIAAYPLLAAFLGALFVGVGTGLCVRAGGAPSGDDALAMSVGRLVKCNVSAVYLMSDLIVLGVSLTYIPLSRIVYSLITVVLSGQIIGMIDYGKKQ